MQIKDIQMALADQGFDPGPVDNVYGPLTRRAIMAFQASRGLAVDGIVGPHARAALFGGAPGAISAIATIPTELPWLAQAHRLLGVVEFPGQGVSNPVIDTWARVLTIRCSGDDVPWCGMFMAHCLATCLPEDPIPSNPLGARNWGKYGTGVAPQFGAIMVFWRGSKAGTKGHVGLYWAEDATHFHVLGGNQSNSVSVVRVARNRLLGARWPAARPLSGLRRLASAEGVVTGVAEA